MKPLTLLISICAALTCIALAEHTDHADRSDPDRVPAIVTDGLDAYVKYGMQSAFDAWLKGSPLARQAPAQLPIMGTMAQIETEVGPMLGYEIIRAIPISPSVRHVYTTILHEKGPVYAWFECYNSQSGWIITAFDASTRATVFPVTVYEGDRR